MLNINTKSKININLEQMRVINSEDSKPVF